MCRATSYLMRRRYEDDAGPNSGGATMPIHYAVDHETGRLLTVAEGVVTYDDINSHLDAETRSRDVARPELVDARLATTTITSDQVRQLSYRAARMLQSGAVGPTAIVATNDVLFGMARMYSVFAESVGAS